MSAEPSAPVVDFARVFREMAPFVWRALRRLGVREHDAEDVLQDVFVVVHSKLPEFEGRSRLRTWVYGICLRKALDYRRLARVRREVVVETLPEAHAEAEQERQLSMRRACNQLDVILETLDDDKRAVFVLFELEQVPMKDIAALTGVPLPTAYFRLYGARKHVKAALDHGGGEL